MNKKTPPEAGSFAESVLAQTLVFRTGNERFGLPLANVLEVFERSADPTPIPGAPEWVAGMINHHGRVLPVVRMDRLLDVEPDRGEGQLMLVDLDDEHLALEVDQIVALEEVRAEGPVIRGRKRAWLRGMLLTLLEPGMLLRTIRQRLEEQQIL